MPPAKRTISAIITELVEHPFFPILFFGEFCKALVTGVYVAEFGLLALVAMILWAFSDAVSETAEFIQEHIIGSRDDD